MKPSHQRRLKQFFTALEIPTPDTQHLLRRIEFMERNVMLPVKAVFILIVYYSLNFSSRWFGQISNTLDVTVETAQYIFSFYIVANCIFGLVLGFARRLPLAVVEWTVVTCSLVDGLWIAALAYITGGLESVLFWLFVALIVRNSISLPPGFSQLFLNVVVSLCYVLVALLDVFVLSNLDDFTLRALDVTPHEDLGEPFFIRLAVLLLTAVSCYGTQVLLERQRIAVEEAGEFAAREGQLQSAGRVAAEFAHQIKNPLAVINNAAFILQRSLKENKEAAQQIEIIREEVGRVDNVITQVMGYAQLNEGRVEKLNLIEEFDVAISRVFPPPVATGIKIHRDYERSFPPLLMQRNHLSEILVNLLQNAREAVGESGNIHVAANHHRDHTIQISVRDDGQGIPPEKLKRVFEAYFTTKEKGSGLGLSIVKHNVELYAGSVQVESQAGKGAKFTVRFPSKVLMKTSK